MLGVVAVTVMLTSCTAVPGGTATVDPAQSVAPPVPSLSAPQQPALVPDGAAAENLPLFSAVTRQVWASERRAQGRAYIDALVKAGFDKSRMQVTADQTTVGRPVESLQFSVAWGDGQCLMGQAGPSTGEPVTVVMPQLAEGRCLVGATRTIAW